MWRDGFTPEEVMSAFRKQMLEGVEDRKMVNEIKISSEVRLK